MSVSLTLAASASGIVVRSARDVEMRACRLLLPAAFTASMVPEVLVAPDSEGVRGAVAISWFHRADDPAGAVCFPILVHVVPPARRQGVGRALVAAAITHCRGDADGLRAWSPVPDGSEAASFLDAVGFTPCRRMLFFEAEGAVFHAMVERIRARLERAGRIGAASRITALREAPAEAVAALLAGDFPAPASDILRRLEATAPDAFDLDRSVALFVDGSVVGALLYSWNGGAPSIDALAVAPAFRGTSAVVLLLEAATRNGLQGGATRFTFSCDEKNRDTTNLARRCGATFLKAEAEYRLLGPARA